MGSRGREPSLPAGRAAPRQRVTWSRSRRPSDLGGSRSLDASQRTAEATSGSRRVACVPELGRPRHVTDGEVRSLRARRSPSDARCGAASAERPRLSEQRRPGLAGRRRPGNGPTPHSRPVRDGAMTLRDGGRCLRDVARCSRPLSALDPRIAGQAGVCASGRGVLATATARRAFAQAVQPERAVFVGDSARAWPATEEQDDQKQKRPPVAVAVAETPHPQNTRPPHPPTTPQHPPHPPTTHTPPTPPPTTTTATTTTATSENA